VARPRLSKTINFGKEIFENVVPGVAEKGRIGAEASLNLPYPKPAIFDRFVVDDGVKV
jgi:hypothetical protein